MIHIINEKMSSISRRYFVVLEGTGSELSQSSDPRNITVYEFPQTDSYVRFSRSYSSGISFVSAATVVNEGISGGAKIVASSVSLLTTKGQILTSNGVTNVVLPPPPANGKVLRYDATQATGLYWGDPTVVSGDVNPTPNSIPQRDANGALLGAGYITSGNITVPVDRVYTIGVPGTRFMDGYFFNLTPNMVTTTSITNTDPITINSTSSVNLSVSASNVLTVTSTGVSVVGRVATNAAGALQIGPDATVGSWRLAISGSSLVVQRYEGAAWVTKGQFDAS